MPNDGKKKAAKALMERSERKKDAARTQERIGNAQIKNKVKEGSMGSLHRYTKRMEDVGSQIPVGKQRLDIAKRLRSEATRDSLASVRMYPGENKVAKSRVSKTVAKAPVAKKRK
jgi:hypothetical protein